MSVLITNNMRLSHNTSLMQAVYATYIRFV